MPEETMETSRKEDNTGLIIVSVLLTLFIPLIGGIIAYFLLKDKEHTAAIILLIIGLLGGLLILIIATAGLFALGLTKPCRWIGTQVTIPGGFSSDRGSIRMTKIANGNHFQMTLTNGLPDDATFAADALTFRITSGNTTTWPTAETTISPYETQTISIDITGSNALNTGDCYAMTIGGTYKIGGSLGTSHDFYATVSGIVV